MHMYLCTYALMHMHIQALQPQLSVVEGAAERVEPQLMPAMLQLQLVARPNPNPTPDPGPGPVPVPNPVPNPDPDPDPNPDPYPDLT